MTKKEMQIEIDRLKEENCSLKKELIFVHDKFDKYVLLTEEIDENNDNRNNLADNIISNLDDKIKIQENIIEVLKAQNIEDKLEINSIVKDSKKDFKDSISKGNMYFHKGSGHTQNSKYCLVDDNLNNEYEKPSYGSIFVQTKKGQSFDLVLFSESIGIFKSPKEPIQYISLNYILEAINKEEDSEDKSSES